MVLYDLCTKSNIYLVYVITNKCLQENGLICMEDLQKAIRPDTSLVSIMMVNNEIGVQQPVDEIGQLCRSKKIFFHTDAAQVFN